MLFALKLAYIFIVYVFSFQKLKIIKVMHVK